MNLFRRRNGDLFPTLRNDFLEEGFWPNLVHAGNDFLGYKAPPANVAETKEEFRVDLSAPGLTRNDFKIEIEDGTLTISSEKKEESNNVTENYRRREFSYSSFSRSFQLPENIKEDKISAKYDNGMLHISIPKKEIGAAKQKKEIQIV